MPTDKYEPTFDQFLLVVQVKYEKARSADPDLRVGQHFFNTLYVIRPDLADGIRGTKLDPFYRNDVPQETYNHLIDRW